MYISKIFIIIFLSVLLSAQFCFGQRATSAKDQNLANYTDTTKRIMPAESEDLIVEVRLLPETILEKYKNDPAFNYDNKQEETEDWITKIKNWINQQLALLRSSEVFSTALDYFYYALAILALILIIRGLIKADRRGLLFGKVSNNQIKIMENEEDINQINFDELISAAIGNKQYKLAIRYLFLKSLKLLSERKLIEFRSNKTNRQYLLEINNSQIASAFQDTTFRFEWIWYGNFPIDEDIMKNSQNDFNKLFRLITT